MRPTLVTSQMSRWMAPVFVLLATSLGLVGHNAPTQASPAPPSAAMGHVTGRVATAGGARAARFIFTLDGVRVRARLKADRFTLRNLPVGGHTLAIFQAGTSRAAYVPVRIRRNATERLSRVELVVGGQITGIVTRVVDPHDTAGEPISGVEVVAERVSDDGTGGGKHGGRRVSPSTARLVAVTDKSGAYAFRGAPPGSYEVSVAVPGLEGGLNWVYVEANRTAVADFQLREAVEEGVGKVRGRISDAEGVPVEGALVSVYTDDVWAASTARGVRVINPGYFSTLTDENGDYALNIPSGHGHLIVYAEGYLPAQQNVLVRRRQVLVVDLSLEADTHSGLATLAGQVVNQAGEPIAGAVITLTTPYGGPADGGGGVNPVLTAETDKHGYFHFEAVPAGTWIAWVETSGYVPLEEVLELKPGVAKDIQFVMLRPIR